MPDRCREVSRRKNTAPQFAARDAWGARPMAPLTLQDDVRCSGRVQWLGARTYDHFSDAGGCEVCSVGSLGVC